METPDPGLYKVNFNGATFADDSCSGLGVIVRDGAGLVIAAESSGTSSCKIEEIKDE